MSEKECAYYRTLYEVAKGINSSLEPVTVLRAIVEQVAKALDAKGCSIRLLDKKGKTLLASTSYGLSKGYLRKGPVEVAKSKIDQETLAGQIVQIKDAGSDPRFQYPEAAKEEGIASVMALPLTVEGRAIGVLRLYCDKVREFEQGEVHFATAIANLSAIAIENARLHQALKTDYELLTAYDYTIHE
ncbi:putative phytochrome sensor protein [Solidesulfovibrio fructosivorans JJ]]|uniref:Putative phytochrome sensor protein n=1 Tax=Solidesulfovibrio fructosivorans JJ] TaxID=596151 RepID=E1JUJ8_SOLFR|nr:GAF domain-containing protein [Solidesulfovibrio fructosivorans]EFL52128.1 putative phytochrome sensor protein [Solidesulfovibrio fructosivorans JJ]]